MKMIDYLVAHKLTDEAFAVVVGGVSRHGVRKWRYGERIPDAKRIARIEEVTSGAVTFRDWFPVALQAQPKCEAAA